MRELYRNSSDAINGGKDADDQKRKRTVVKLYIRRGEKGWTLTLLQQGGGISATSANIIGADGGHGYRAVLGARANECLNLPEDGGAWLKDDHRSGRMHWSCIKWQNRLRRMTSISLAKMKGWVGIRVVLGRVGGYPRPGKPRVITYAISSVPFKDFDVTVSPSENMQPPRFKSGTRDLKQPDVISHYYILTVNYIVSRTGDVDFKHSNRSTFRPHGCLSLGVQPMAPKPLTGPMHERLHHLFIEY
ncbi:hypothetical protein PIB30_071449 [Stylosanthes scabra]|uniref:Uncharacterized protein n=1 Tax=Stylosanthes scabra TaxID=79078 RepID=A0ABU6XNF3_9FABA|nr:hypothetical protein [Stylosanthes scabra]